MPLVQVRDVPEPIVATLKQLAAARGLTVAGLLRIELRRIAGRPSNTEVLDRILSHERSGGPKLDEILAAVEADGG